MYINSKTFSYLKFISWIMITAILMYYVLAYFQQYKLDPVTNSIAYFSLVYLYAFQAYVWIATNWPLKTKNDLISLDGDVLFVTHHIEVTGAGKERRKDHKYFFTVSKNTQSKQSQKCLMVRRFRLKIDVHDHIKVVGLMTDNNVLNISAIKNYTKNTIRTNNLLFLMMILFLSLLIPLLLTFLIFTFFHYSLIICFILIALKDLILIPIGMIPGRSIDLTIESISRLSSKNNKLSKPDFIESIKRKFISSRKFIISNVFLIENTLLLVINTINRILINKYSLGFIIVGAICISLYIYLIKPTYESGLTYFNNEDYSQAIEIWKKIAVSDNDIQAQLKLAHIYENGKIITADNEEALKWYLRAAKQNNTEAEYKAAIIMDKKIERKVPNSEIIFWYLKAAKKGNISAQVNLAQFYRTKERNHTKAIEWYKKAIAHDNADAKFQLAIIYEYDKKDKEKAVYWYLEALKQNTAYTRCCKNV